MTKLYDEKGHEVVEGAVIRVFHFIGARRKRHYMYKQVSVSKGELYALHLGQLTPTEGRGYLLKHQADSAGLLKGHQVMQCYYCPKCKWPVSA